MASRPDKLIYSKRLAKSRLLIAQNKVLVDTLHHAKTAFDDEQRQRIIEAGIRLSRRYEQDIKKITD